ncbi:hypothetical protein AEGHOMDF_1670 [Methylobacterium soli]|nr:hypothetical protein AEGHOMDF_1670 [Methylobacterium soli]
MPTAPASASMGDETANRMHGYLVDGAVLRGLQIGAVELVEATVEQI